MAASIVIEPGARFGRLVVLAEAERRLSPNGQPLRRVHVECDCGQRFDTNLGSLRSGKTRSCGCLKVEASRARATKHGMRHTGLYWCWCNMKQRSSGHYPRPAYAGVGRDQRWDSFDNFRADMEATYFPGAVLARIGDVGDYGPTNSRWLTASANNSERRKKKK